MLSVSKLSPGQEAYYERSVAAGIDDYYAGRGESPGVWVGRGAAELELEGVVGEGELGRLIGGRHPLSSAVLRSHPPKKQITVERIDPATGERRLEEKTLSPVAGYDLVFSPPKSVSLLHALGSEEVRHAVDLAHLAAWQAALAYLEQEACVTRRGKNGVVRERGSGFVAAAYQHRTSRAQDPHLHTHVIVANMTKTPSDGEWRALDGEPILKQYRLAAGYLYQAQLRFELTRSLGVEWRQPENGMAEIAGVPDGALRAFSQRRAQVLDYLERRGSSGFYAAKVAALQTRDRKEPLDLPRLRLEWEARAAEHGLGRRELRQVLDRALVCEFDERDAAEVTARLVGPDGLTGKRSTFSGTEAVMAWAQAHTPRCPGGACALARRALSRDRAGGADRSRGGRPAGRSSRPPSCCATSGRRWGSPRAAARFASRSSRRRRSSGSPTTAGRCSAASRRRCCEQSPRARIASSASSATRAPARRPRSPRSPTRSNVTGTSRSAPPRPGLPPRISPPRPASQAALSIGSSPKHDSSGGLPRRCLLVVDEAGMADTRTLTDVLFQVEHAAGKAVLVGDPAQLPAVGPGGLYAAIVARNGAVELHDNRRQRDELERSALALLRAGRSRDYLAHAAEQGRLTVAANRTEAKAHLIADWWQAACTDLPGSAMIAYRRADVAELNAVARTLLDREGRLGRDRLQLDNGTELAAGDRVLCTRNDRRLAVANGSRGTVHTVDRDRNAIVVELDDSRRVTLPARYLEAGHVSLAYALTGHKTQGLTLERAFVLADDQRALKEWGYVALTRSRHETRLYTIATDLQPDAPPQRPEPADPLDRLADALTRPAAETLALDAAATRQASPSRRSRPARTTDTPARRPAASAREGTHPESERAAQGEAGARRPGHDRPRPPRPNPPRADQRTRTDAHAARPAARPDRTPTP